MRILGELCLLSAFIGSGYGAFACLLSQHPRWSGLVRTGVGAGVVACAGLAGTIIALAWALVTKDFRLEYVAHYTSRELPWHYALSALWVGQAGSLLLWTWMLSLLSIVFLLTAPKDGRLRVGSFGILLTNVCFLTAIMVFAADPMKTGLSTRSEGLGLSPLLQHPSMLVHPPVVFLAYAAWTVPFAVAVSALAFGELDERWTQVARPWALFAWVVLAGGLLLGADWAYQELGWGGYWGWDPVENGSLLPWLTGTALIHGLMTWRHRRCLKKTTVSLAIVTFGLCNFATFLTRSGIFSSVHAFSQSPIGWMFLGLLAVLLVGGLSFIAWRRRELAAERRIGSLFARESFVLASIYLLALLTAVVLVGTLYTPLSALVVGRMVQIGPEFYNFVLMPIALLLLAATSAVPLLRWGAAPRPSQQAALGVCGLLGVAAAGTAVGLGMRHPAAIAVAGLAAITVSAFAMGVMLDIRRHSNSELLSGAWLTLRANRRQYAGYVVHVGFACVVIGVTGSSLGARRQDVDLNEGQAIDWAGRNIEVVRLVQRAETDKLVAEVELRVSRSGERPVILKPARHLHLLQNQWTTEVAIHSTWRGDFYTILHAGLGDGRVAITLIENPMIRWIWLGGWLSAGGVGVAAWPARRKRTRQGRHFAIDQHPATFEPARRRAA